MRRRSLLALLPFRFRILIPVSVALGAFVLTAAFVFAGQERGRTEAAVAADIGRQRSALLDDFSTIDRLVSRQVQTAMLLLRDLAARQGTPGISCRCR